VVDVDDFATLCIGAEDVDSFTELFRLKYNGLENLDERKGKIYEAGRRRK